MEDKEEIDKNKLIKEDKSEQNKNSINNNSSEESNNLTNNLKKFIDGEEKQNIKNKEIESTDITNEHNKSNNKEMEKRSDIKINDIKEEDFINKKELNEEENNINIEQEKNEIILEEKPINEYINITEDEGIRKKIIKEGKGTNPKEGNEVTINYIGKYDNIIFEQSNEEKETSFIIGENKVIKGWDIAVKTMKLGEKSEFIMKPEYTYGDKQINENIPPNSILTYEIELKCIHYKNTEDCLENLTYEEKIQWGTLLKQNGVQKFKENDISGAREFFIKALNFLKTMDPKKEEEKEGVDLLLTIVANICNCFNKEKDYESVIKFSFIGLHIKPTPKLLYFRTIAFAQLEEFDEAENNLKELIELFKSNGEDNNEKVNDTVNYLRELIDSRKLIFNEKNKKFSRAIYRQVLHNNKNTKYNILVPNNISNIENSFVFFEIQIGEKNVGKIEFELFKDVVPITTENFRNLCIGTQDELTYKNTCINKIIKDFVLGGGELENKNEEYKCIYGQYFDDENYNYGHCRRGLLTMDNDGKNKNNSKYFITLNHIPWFDGKHVVFGQVINGMDIIEQIEKIETDKDDKPLIKITIINCGEISKENVKIIIDDQIKKYEEKKIIESNKKMEEKKETEENNNHINELNENRINEEIKKDNSNNIKKNINEINIQEKSEINKKEDNNDLNDKNN